MLMRSDLFEEFEPSISIDIFSDSVELQLNMKSLPSITDSAEGINSKVILLEAVAIKRGRKLEREGGRKKMKITQISLFKLTYLIISITKGYKKKNSNIIMRTTHLETKKTSS